jgi:hypothetical protein
MDRAYRTETIVAEDSTVQLRDLPFRPGEAVEVIVISSSARVATSNGRVSLRGSVLRYDSPTEPVAEDDWELGG